MDHHLPGLLGDDIKQLKLWPLDFPLYELNFVRVMV